MKSVHLEHLFDRLRLDNNILDNELFCTPSNNNVNTDLLCKILKRYGYARKDVLDALAAVQPDTLEALEDSEQLTDISILNMDATTKVILFELLESDNVVIPKSSVSSGSWDGLSSPANDAYFNGSQTAWSAIASDTTEIALSPYNTRNAPWNNLNSGWVDTFGGMDVTDGNIDLSVMSMDESGSTSPYGYGYSSYGGAYKFGFITITSDGTVVTNYLYDDPVGDGGQYILDCARIDGKMYYIVAGTESRYIRVTEGPWTGENITSTTVPGFDTHDFGYGDPYCDVQKAGITTIGTDIYMCLTLLNNTIIAKYDTVAESTTVLHELDNTTSIPLMDFPKASEFISPNTLVIGITDNTTPYLYGYDISGTTPTELWQRAIPVITNTETAYPEISGMSYNPATGYLYVMEDGILVRFK